MRTSFLRTVLAGLAVLAFQASAPPTSQAQPTPTPPPTPAPAPDPNPIFLGLPEFYVEGVDLSFYSLGRSQSTGKAWRDAEDAVRACDKDKFEQAKRQLGWELSQAAQEAVQRANALAAGTSTDILGLRRLLHDIAQMAQAFQKIGNYEDRCTK